MIKVLDLKRRDVIDGRNGLEFGKTDGSSSVGTKDLVGHIRRLFLAQISVKHPRYGLWIGSHKGKVSKQRIIITKLWSFCLFGDEFLEL